MSGSVKWSVTDYIKNFALISSTQYQWKYLDIHEKSIFATLVALKSTPSVTKEYVQNTDRYLTGYTNFFKQLSLRVAKMAKDKNKFRSILLNPVPINNPILIEIYIICHNALISEVGSNASQDQLDKFKLAIDSIKEAVLVYLWKYLSYAMKEKCLDQLESEMYLLQEIELFKNLKE